MISAFRTAELGWMAWATHHPKIRVPLCDRAGLGREMVDRASSQRPLSPHVRDVELRLSWAALVRVRGSERARHGACRISVPCGSWCRTTPDTDAAAELADARQHLATERWGMRTGMPGGTMTRLREAYPYTGRKDGPLGEFFEFLSFRLFSGIRG
jgi:hypothetical protein